MEDSVALYSSPCESYINAWRLALLDCPGLETKVQDSTGREALIATITARMVTICQLGTDGANPYGASTVAPAYSNAAWTSFEQLVDHVLDSLHISPGLYCHPYGIEWPKPYSKNPRVTQQQIGVLDTCTCNQWSKLKTEITAAGGNIFSISSVNQYLWNKYGDTLTAVLFNGLQQCGQPYLYNC
ncbi:MAG TPA: hypothetical protein VFS31_09185, partial [Chitinophagaceae bacterium]|nr:hypothetical protein [Chitinophagaceae bacterium]